VSIDFESMAWVHEHEAEREMMGSGIVTQVNGDVIWIKDIPYHDVTNVPG